MAHQRHHTLARDRPAELDVGRKVVLGVLGAGLDLPRLEDDRVRREQLESVTLADMIDRAGVHMGSMWYI